MEERYTNRLISESSPYLLQHAHNPVAWVPYANSVLKEAQERNKLLIISIGYAACHWCHVMEHESFEDEQVAEIMNKHFISIKVDREERPDIDQVYIQAVQLMTGTAGWPLNVVALPDGRPVWGGTYFRKTDWISALNQIQKLYEQEPETLLEYASRLEKGIKSMDVIPPNKTRFDTNKLVSEKSILTLKQSFDKTYGGFGQAPKFMMPNLLQFLQRYAHTENDSEVSAFVQNTLEKMAFGGIYDAIGGGFSRYSVDDRWHIPHFEKMLYDNALLISLYAEAFKITPNPLYREVIEETIQYIQTELQDATGLYYSSWDADSKNQQGQLEEGAFYTFDRKEIQAAIGDDFDLFKVYYNINANGEWEDGRYVLIRTQSDKGIADTFLLDLDTLRDKKQAWKANLSAIKRKRAKPRLDDKMITSWNAMMIKSLIDASQALSNQDYLESTVNSAETLFRTVISDNVIFHVHKNGKSYVDGFLEDYAFVIDLALSLYESTFDWKWITRAVDLSEYVLDHFFDEQTSMFYFTSKHHAPIIYRNSDYYDNVIPSSNSVMAKNLFRLSKLTGVTTYQTIAQQMLHNLLDQMENHPRGFGNWMDLGLNFKSDFYEIVVTGPNAIALAQELKSHYLPFAIIAATEEPREEFIFKNRFNPNKPQFYLCKNNTCRTPFNTIKETLENL